MQNHLQVESVKLKSERDLRDYFASHAKPICMHRIGIEAEFLAVDRKTGTAVGYAGKNGVAQILSALASLHYYHPVKQGNYIIALNRKDLSVSLEPGGQIELSAPPVSTVFQAEEQVKQFVQQLKSVEKKIPSVQFLSTGIQPFSHVDEIDWMPKDRYKIMRRRLVEHGALSHWMMKMTATNQVNFDYADEEDASRKMRAALFATPVAAALFSNSSFSEGALNGYRSLRMHIWRETDKTRSGFLTRFLKGSWFFRDYLDYVLDVPMLFIIRGKKYVEVKGLTFRQYIRSGYEGEEATLADFELHLTAVFPDVRLKQYLEVRCVDAQPPERIAAVTAFWKGLLYSKTGMDNVFRLFKKVTEDDLQNAYAVMPELGMEALLAGKPLLHWARDLTGIAFAGLSEQTTSFEQRNESIFLEPLMADLEKGRSPANFILAGLERAPRKSPQNRLWILDRLRI